MSAVSVLLSPQDEAFGERLSAALSRRGHTARLLTGDQADLFAARDIDDDAAIVVWSNAALKLADLHEQAREALQKGAVIPVALDETPAPGEFEGLRPIDLSGWSGDDEDPHWRFVLETLAVATALRTREEAEAIPDNAAEPGLPPPRRVRRARARRRRFDPAAVATMGIATLCLMTGGAIILSPSVMSRGDKGAGAANDASLAGLQTPARDVVSPDQMAAAATNRSNETGPLAIDAPEGVGEGDISYPGDSAPTVDPAVDEIHLALLGPVAPAEDLQNNIPPTEESEPATISRETALVGPGAPSLKPAEEEAPTIDALLADTPAPGSEMASGAGDVFRDCLSCPDMAVIAAGAFTMGPGAGDTARGNEGPARKITLAAPFALAIRETTFAEWDACVADGGCTAYEPSDHGWGRGEQPVVSVSYEDALGYASWISEKTGHEYRLPSEAEWEFAARAGATTAFSFGEGLAADDANYDGRYAYAGKKGRWLGKPMQTGSYPANAFGLHDMHGNVWEWTADCWSTSLAGLAGDGAARGGNCKSRVLKGGAYNTGGWRLRAAHRIGKPAKTREMEIGFRVARVLK